MKNIMVLMNPMTLFMVLFLIFGIRSLTKRRFISAAAYLILFGCLAFNTVLLFLRVEQSRRLSEERDRREMATIGASNQASQPIAASAAQAER